MIARPPTPPRFSGPTSEIRGKAPSERTRAPKYRNRRKQFASNGLQYSGTRPQTVGVTDYLYRWYDTFTSRWPSRDPIQERGGVNLYGFTRNDGVNRIDRLGRYTIGDAAHSLVQSQVQPLGTIYEGGARAFTDKQLVDEWYRMEKTKGDWWSGLPKCPKKLCIKRVPESTSAAMPPVPPITTPAHDVALNIYAQDPTQWLTPKVPSNAESNLHPGTAWTMRSKLDANGHANQCTYDSKGILLRTPPGSGTVDWKESGTIQHYRHDVEPVYMANSLDGGAVMGVISSTFTGGPSILGTPGENLNKYYEVRPLWAEDP